MEILSKSKTATELADTTFRLVVACQRVQEHLADEAGVTIPEFRTLRLFLDEGPVHIKYLIERLGLSASRLSRILDSLEKKAFLTRSIDRTDRRNILVTLTPKGADLSAKLRSGCGAIHALALERIPAEAHEKMLTTMQHLLSAVELCLAESKHTSVNLQCEGLER
jgi:DNA-binding MarR family transcriptional regulator